MMNVISFFFSLFSTIVWLIASGIIVAIILFFVNRPLFAKGLNYVAAYVSSEGHISMDTKSNVRGKRRKYSSTSDNDRISEKLKQALRRITELEQRERLMNTEMEEKDDTINKLRKHLMLVQDELALFKQKGCLVDEPVVKKKENFQASTLHRDILFAYAPTSVSPYGFSVDDWQQSDNGHVFVMTQLSSSEAYYMLNENCSNANILGSLAYYDRLIDYEDNTNGNNASKIEMTRKGRLRLIGNVWTIENKIKIKLL